MLVTEQSAKLGDHRAGPGWPVPGGQVSDEAVQPAWRVGEPGGQVSGLDERPFGTALPARRAQPQSFMPFDLPALRASPGRVFGLAGPGARPAPAGVLPQIPWSAAPRAGPLGCRLPGLAPAVPAQGVLLAADRMPALRADPRAQHAPPGTGLKDPLLPAPGTRHPGRGLGDLPPAQAAVLTADDAHRRAAPGAVPLLLAHRPVLVREAASTGPGPERPSDGPMPGAAARRAGPPGWYRPRTSRSGCIPARCTTRLG